MLPLGVKKQIRRPIVWVRHTGIGSADAMVCAYPKSGSTWLRFMLYEALTGEPAGFGSVNRGIPDPKAREGARRLLPGGGRVFVSHDRYCPSGSRVVYMVRDVRDVLLSEYRGQLRTGDFNGDLATFLGRFLDGRVNYYGSWMQHVSFWLSGRQVPQEGLFVVRYESLRRDPASVLAKTLEFLGARVEPSTVAQAVENNSLERMRAKEEEAPSGAIRTIDPGLHFVGQGLAGGWRQALTKTQARRIESDAREELSRLGYPLEEATSTGQPSSGRPTSRE